MEFSIKQSSPEKQSSSCLVVGVYQDRQLSAAADAVNQVCNNLINTLFESGDLTGKSGSSLMLHQPAGLSAARLLLIGLGKQEEFNAKAYIEACNTANSVLRLSPCSDAVFYFNELPLDTFNTEWKISKLVQATAEADHRSDQLKSEPEPPAKLHHITLGCSQAPTEREQQTMRRAVAIASGTSLCKDLGNLPGNICTPTYLAEQARTMSEQHNLKLTVLEESDMEELGMYSFLAVAKGSDQPGKLICLEYHGTDPAQKPIVLVGKGVTFDSGGISIKPGMAMDEMKYDMCGAAATLGTMKAVVEMKLPVNLTIVVPATENLPNGKASKPGDIVTSLSGQTIEILNTDAEGRLILCDALTYSARFNPEVVIDIATLTGACVVALGNHATALYSNTEQLADELQQAGEYSYDRLWPMPLWDEYQKQLDSNFADMQNIGGREAGSNTAACFLSRFTKDYQWAHLDIAGTAWRTGKTKGATGRPVPLLTQFLINRADTASS